MGVILRGLTALILTSVCSVAMALPPDSRVENFRLLDHQGGSHELYYFSDAPALVLMSHSSTCKAAEPSLERFKALQVQYADAGVEFMLLNSADDRNLIRAHANRLGLDAPVLMDATQIIGEALAMTRAGELLLIEPASWTVKYRGDAETGADALQALLAGASVPSTGTPITGCDVDLPELARRDSHAEISYANDIAPILKDNCVTCHREGGIGPWAMNNYDMVRGFSLMIREVVRTQRMPPWHADPHHGEFVNDRSMSADDVRTLVHWIEAGAPRGEGEDPLLERASYPQWALGEPDVIIEIPAEDVPATGVVDYKYKMVDNPLTEDVWVRASEILPGDRSVLHHVITRFGTMETAGPRTGRLKRGSGGGLGGYVPGAVAREYPQDTGTFLPADATFEFQMHYTTSGKAATDVSRIGLYLYDEPPKYAMSGMVLANPRINIPAGAANHAEIMARTLKDDVLLYSLLPHAHYRGKASEFVAHYPDGTTEKLVSVPRYDFNWQTTYVLKEPKVLPAGTRIVHRTWWDNSSRNPANPDHTRNVPWGRQSWDEMLFGAMSFRVLEAEERTPQQTGGAPVGGE